MNLILIQSLAAEHEPYVPVGLIGLWPDNREIPWGWEKVQTPPTPLDLDTPMTKFVNGIPVK